MVNSNGECEALCSSVATSTCVDVALMSQVAHEGVQSTVCKTLYLNCVPIPYVAFQQLFFKNSVFKPNETLVNQSALFNQYVVNNDRHITNEGSECVLDNAAAVNPLNLYEQMKVLYMDKSETLAGCWDTCSKIKFTKSVSKIKKLTDLTHVCPVECSLSLDDMFCALEANDEHSIMISEDTNMPEPPAAADLDCPPQLSQNYFTGGSLGGPIALTSDKFVWVPPSASTTPCTGPSSVCLTITDCSSECNPIGEFYVEEVQAQDNVKTCDNEDFIGGGTILISGIYVDGIAGAGGQYILYKEGESPGWAVKYWKASAIVNITTRLNGKVPLLNAAKSKAVRDAASDAASEAATQGDASGVTDFVNPKIPSKGVALDIVWRFKVDLTPASSGTGGFGWARQSRGAEEIMGEPYGWSFPSIRMSDDRQRKSIPRDQAIKLMTSLKQIKTIFDDNLVDSLDAAGN